MYKDIYHYYKYRNSQVFFMWLCVCVFVNWSPDWEIWPNYEVVEFQPRSGIATVVDSVAFIKVYYSLLPPHLFQISSGSPSPL